MVKIILINIILMLLFLVMGNKNQQKDKVIKSKITLVVELLDTIYHTKDLKGEDIAASATMINNTIDTLYFIEKPQLFIDKIEFFNMPIGIYDGGEMNVPYINLYNYDTVNIIKLNPRNSYSFKINLNPIKKYISRGDYFGIQHEYNFHIQYFNQKEKVKGKRVFKGKVTSNILHFSIEN